MCNMYAVKCNLAALVDVKAITWAQMIARLAAERVILLEVALDLIDYYSITCLKVID